MSSSPIAHRLPTPDLLQVPLQHQFLPMRCKVILLVPALHPVRVLKQVLQHEYSTGVAFVLAHTLNGHLERPQVVLEFEVDSALGGRELHFIVVFLPFDLVDLGDILR